MTLILAGPVRSYKTTTLEQWCAGRTDCGGVLSPDRAGGRCLRNVRTGEEIAWQKSTTAQPDDLLIGRFVFDAGAFQTAIGWLKEAVADPLIRYILLDEVGPLELSGKGWDRWLRQTLPLPEEKTLILVARTAVVEDVRKRYDLA